MAKRSGELEQFFRDMIGAIETSDIRFIERTTSHEDGVVAIGSDPSEVAEGYDQIIPLMRSSTPEAPPERGLLHPTRGRNLVRVTYGPAGPLQLSPCVAPTIAVCCEVTQPYSICVGP